MKIQKQFKNLLLLREEYSLKIESDTNPTFANVKEALKKEGDLTIVKNVRGGFGNNNFNAEVIVYDSQEAKDKVEKISRKARKKLKEETAKAQGGAPAK